jgi:hypothetical protein
MERKRTSARTSACGVWWSWSVVLECGVLRRFPKAKRRRTEQTQREGWGDEGGTSQEREREY